MQENARIALYFPETEKGTRTITELCMYRCVERRDGVNVDKGI